MTGGHCGILGVSSCRARIGITSKLPGETRSSRSIATEYEGKFPQKAISFHDLRMGDGDRFGGVVGKCRTFSLKKRSSKVVAEFFVMSNGI